MGKDFSFIRFTLDRLHQKLQTNDVKEQELNAIYFSGQQDQSQQIFGAINLGGADTYVNTQELEADYEKYKQLINIQDDSNDAETILDEYKEDILYATSKSIGEEGGGELDMTSKSIGEEGGGELDMTSKSIGEEGGGEFDMTSKSIGEEGGGGFDMTSKAIGEEGGEGFPRPPMISTDAVGEEGGGEIVTSNAIGEEGGEFNITSKAIGEEGGGEIVTSNAIGEEGGENFQFTSKSIGEEGGGDNLPEFSIEILENYKKSLEETLKDENITDDFRKQILESLEKVKEELESRKNN